MIDPPSLRSRVRCVLSTEYAVRPTSAAEHSVIPVRPRMWAGASTGRGICVRNSAVRAAVRSAALENAHGERSL